MCQRTCCPVAAILVLLTVALATLALAELSSPDTITTANFRTYCDDRPSNSNSGGGDNSTWERYTDSSSETEYDRIQRRQAELCRQGKIGAPGQLQDGCSMWRFRYIDEQPASGFEVKIVDESLDRRLANIIYTSIAAKPLVADTFKVTGDDPEEMEQNFRSFEGPWVHAEQCSWQLEQMVAQLDELGARLATKRQNASFRLGLDERHIRLARTMDSYGRYEAGLLQGKYQSVGSFKECTSSQLLLPARQTAGNSDRGQRGEELVRTRFCWANMDLSKHRSASLKARQTDPFEASEHMLQLGVCLPRSCHTRSFLESRTRNRAAAGAAQPSDQQVQQNRELLQRLIDSQFKLPGSLYIDESLPLHSVFCLADEQSAVKVPLSGKLALAFVGVWLLVAVYATYYQEMGRKLQAGSRKKSDDAAEAAAGAIGLVGGNFVESHKWAQEVVDCLNLKKSWQDFVGEEYGDKTVPKFERPDSRVNLDTLNMIKVFGCMFVVLGHAMVVIAIYSVDSMNTYKQLESDSIALSMLTGTLVVDTFFIITGLVMGYVAMSKSANLAAKRAKQTEPEKRSNGAAWVTSRSLVDARQGATATGLESAEAQPQRSRPKPLAVVFVKHWLHGVASRYLRLVPLLFIVYWLKRSVYLPYMSFNGPLSDSCLNRHSLFGSCKHESWWTPFNMMPAFLPLSRQCLAQAWSVASDLFFTVTLTPILLIMTKRPKLALMLGLAVGLVSWIWSTKMHLSLPAHREVEMVHMRAHGFSLLFGSYSNLYTNPHLRYCSILVGILAGYMTHVYDTDKNFEWPKWMRGWATRLSFAQLVLIFVAITNLQELKLLFAGYERYLFANVMVAGRIMWCLANGILLTRMVTDWRNSVLMRISASKFWATMVRLNLAILLLHMDLLLHHMYTSLVADYFSNRSMFALFRATYFICVPLAIFVHIVYDNPIYKLTKRHVLPLF